MMRKSWLAFGVLAVALCFLPAAIQPAMAEETFELDMRGVDIREFINTVSKLTNKTIVVDERVKGDVNIKSPRQLTASELYEVFLLQLGVSGFSVVDMGSGILKVIPNQAAKIEGIPVQIEGDESLQSESIITRIVQVQNVDVDKLIPSLRPLIDNRTGVITPYSASNVILITDRESNVRRLLQIIQQVDKADSQSMETVPLNNASAKELERILTKLINDQAKEQGTPKPIITSDLRTNTLVIFGDQNSRTYLKKLIKELDSEITTSSNVRVHYLRYAKAEDMVPVLKSVSEAMLKQEGEKEAASKSNINIEAHEQTNSVVLSGSPHIIRNLGDVIDRLDIRRAQVLVEAIIIELTDRRAKELGVQWLFRGDPSGTAPIGGINFGSTTPAGIFNVAGAASAGGDVLSGVLGSLQGVSLGVGKIRDNGFSFGALMTALASDTESNILSTPSLLTLDNQEASILVGSEVPVITGSTASANNANPFQTITRQEIGIKLTVTPQINEGDAVQLSLQQEVSSLSGLSASDIITDKRTISTTVLVNDSQTIVLGGLIDDDIQESTEKVPILGDMPIIGRLFRADRTQKVKRNLMVFIRPTIVRDSETLRGLSSEKYNYIRAQQIMMHDGGINLFPNAKAPVLPAWTGLDPSPEGMLPELEGEVDPNAEPENP
tara:strand:+ start:876 stop:2873 length:1998 start_codon:yes stop_codon:yes gene_type:complete